MNASDSPLCFLTVLLSLVLLLSVNGCGRDTSTPSSLSMPPDNSSKPAPPGPDASPPPHRVREPAVAGLFYPADPKALGAMLDKLLAAAPQHDLPTIRALVCPHAGYEYSGPIAATGYKQLVGRDIRTVVLLAPSHYALFDGVSVLDADAYRTPLGLVRISAASAELAKTRPFRLEPRGGVRRPSWTWQASKQAGSPDADTPETWEHSGEVQVPFLQKTLREFSLVSLVFGQVDPEAVARALGARLDNQTLLVASSDLSHYHPYETARKLDQGCVQAICDLDVNRLKEAEACGLAPILTVVHLARQRGWQARLLDYRNSGDTAGDRRGVVGYAAIAFVEPAKTGQTEPTGQFNAAERRQLLALARRALEESVRTGRLPEPELKDMPPSFQRPGACFVTLTKRGELRGCIGNLAPRQPLYQAVMDNARAAALNDYRFDRVQPSELPELKIEVSVLTEPKPLAFSSPEDLLAKLRPHTDGVILRMGLRSATFLPQVWEKIPDKVTFLNHLAQKAGCPPDAWRAPGTQVETYQVEAFEETKTQ